MEDIQNALTAQGLPFQPNLVRKDANGYCHIHYEPTVRGFKVAAEDFTVSELFFNVDTLAFLSHRDRVIGDSLNVSQSILRQVGQPLLVTLSLNASYPERFYQDAAKYAYGETSKHQFRFQHNPAEEYDPWIQDYLKFGHANGQPKALLTHRAFEGSREMGRILEPMLDSFRDERFVRSKLSFEGGDLQFGLHPTDRSKLVLFHGTAGKQYFGDSLSNDEYAYVMRLEFGADESVYLGDVTPHVDYTLALLPADNIALVARPECSNPEVARASVGMLRDEYAGAVPPELAELERLLTRFPAKAETLEAIQAAKGAHSAWKAQVDPAVRERIGAYVGANCPNNPRACVSAEAIPQLLQNHMKLLEDWVEAGAQVRMKEAMNANLLALIEQQVAGCDTSKISKLDADGQLLKDMGYRVVSVPWISGNGSWPGISYVNSALIEHTLFVPQLGLGKVEGDWMQKLGSDLPLSYKIVPVPARFLLLRNGGIHCALAFGRTRNT